MSVGHLKTIKLICARIFQNQRDIDSVKELRIVLNSASPTIVKTLEPIIFPVFFPILKSISESSANYKEKEKQEIVDTFRAIFDKIWIEKVPLFFNIYGFLLFEIYDSKHHRVLNISEEYKLSIVQCMTSLSKNLSSSVIEELYVKQNAPKLCQMIYVMLEIAKIEQFKALRIAAINCIMVIARVLDDNDFDDIVMRNQIADVFLFFLPGVATQLKSVALIDEKFGHKIPTVALKAWGRIVTLLMQDYNAHDRKIDLGGITDTNTVQSKKWENEAELEEYLKTTERSPQWYKNTDKKLQMIIVEFAKLTHHSHLSVRLELAEMAALLLENCVHTMPTSITHLIDIIIILSEDSDDAIAQRSKQILEDLSIKLTRSEFKSLLDNLEESFYSVVASIPRKFNGIDERVQIVALNSLIGYITLFGKHSLTRVLYSSVHLNRLLTTLIHISEFDKSGISVLEEYTTPDYELSQDLKTSWKKFRHFKETEILDKIGTVCRLLAKYGASFIVTDFLLDVIGANEEQRKEAIFLLNEVVTDIGIQNNLTLFKNVISTYTDGDNWYLPLSVMVDEYGYEHTLSDVQNNIIQVCLLVEGIGKIALTLGKEFQQFLLKTLFLVLERAGSSHPIIRTAGCSALTNISTACQYSTITNLINNNIDYFSFHIERKLNKAKGDKGGLEVLGVVIRYSTQEVLISTCDVIQELLYHTYDSHRTNLNSYLHVFKMFIMGLHRWLNIELIEEPFKTKKQKQDEIEDFQISNLEAPIEDFSDEMMNKTAEEMYKEDMEKSKKELEDEINDQPEEYKKPEPPLHIKLTRSLLTRCLHFLPSKNQPRQLLVLDILKNGVIVLKDWEDELLPIVHQIWGPLVDRFKDFNEPLIINYSFQLLVVLAKLSKEFIRSRTAKEVLPNILAILDKLSTESYLKDKGSAYRYSQNYKLQVTILENLAQIVTCLDMSQQDIEKAFDVVVKYVSEKQLIPLQNSALFFFKTIIMYDPTSIRENVKSLNVSPEYERNVTQLLSFFEDLNE
ncbi:TELO2-interacting protein 1 homolog [Tribolium madens]|uniref:TELO2-interacting protein 1 homolog n=1 Tax=Tribolium madens TaxID=41895 RepID=UPI001CF76299|nr:TELO2-interacting protein 1 homolog [Tribolium madens]XP_044259187.1 TELO2-interacting protein 1 homolog [Tribolium madens]XP_044259188.1 TELO2-interacting protein 1 homolog [Tribolium madens]